MTGYRLSVDFGTSATVALIAWADGRTRQVLFDASPLLPSGVFRGADGVLLTGTDGARAAVTDPAGYEPHPKRVIDEGTVWLGEHEVAVVDLIAAVLRRVAGDVLRIAGQPPDGVVLTHPAAWAGPRRGVLTEAAARAGLGEVALVPEPVAAAAFYLTALERDLPAGRHLVVYDLGAGTCDVAVVSRVDGTMAVVAQGGLPDVGGLDLDAAVVAHLRPAEPDSADAPVWARLEWPRTPADRRARHALWQNARAAKEQLTRLSVADLHLPLLERDVHLTRTEFEAVARPLLERTVDVTVETLRGAGVTRTAVEGVLLVGGASRVPLAASLLHRTLRVAPVVVDQPELVVVEGAAHTPAPTTAAPHTAASTPATPPPHDTPNATPGAAATAPRLAAPTIARPRAVRGAAVAPRTAGLRVGPSAAARTGAGGGGTALPAAGPDPHTETAADAGTSPREGRGAAARIAAGGGAVALLVATGLSLGGQERVASWLALVALTAVVAGLARHWAHATAARLMLGALVVCWVLRLTVLADDEGVNLIMEFRWTPGYTTATYGGDMLETTLTVLTGIACALVDWLPGRTRWLPVLFGVCGVVVVHTRLFGENLAWSGAAAAIPVAFGLLWPLIGAALGLAVAAPLPLAGRSHAVAAATALAVATSAGAATVVAPAFDARTLMLVDGFVSDLAYSPLGDLVAVSVRPLGRNPSVQLREPGSGRLVADLSLGVGPLDAAVAFSPDGKAVAVEAPVIGGRRYSTVGRQEGTFGSAGFGYSVAFDRKGKDVASAGRSGHAYVWRDGSTGAPYEIDTEPPEDGAYEKSVVGYGPDNLLLIANGPDHTYKRVQFWDAGYTPSRRVRGFALGMRVPTIAFDPAHRQLAGVDERGVLRLWELPAGRVTSTVPEFGRVSALAFSPDGKRLAVGNAHGGLVRDVASGRTVMTFGGHVSNVSVLRFSPDGKTLVAADLAGTVRVWPVG
ncbi:hypothetical protein Val02_06670 [Virgisporangium aliadipatigenens]|uniref:Hsp70 family protein n=1 Tax=Virgisporangium aliadipatigenens TaxID=741659 RepID=A0A8J4DNG0_9ACTN|nr:Hsp70 family protein [Virgisporangium aliadipatigenens]GIJ43781.1 hypothetical protein Val02_06670 [Virgisporangium aliadipatigenens]